MTDTYAKVNYILIYRFLSQQFLILFR